MYNRLVDILDGLDGAMAGAVKSCRLISLWGEVVDGRVKKHAEAVKIRNRVLYVATSSSAWAQELTYLKREIIKKFNEKAGEEAIRDIRFKSNFGGI